MADSLSSDTAPAGEETADQAVREKRRSLLRTGLDVRTRFGVAYLALAALVGTAVGLFIVFLGDPGPGSSSWSTFQPKERGEAAAAEIARHVQSRYRLATGDTLVSIVDRDPALQNGNTAFPIGAVAVEPSSRGLATKVYRTNNTLFYALCGLGSSATCAIPGKPTAARLGLLRREILELSLYSFKYAGADAVVAYAPPTKAKGKTLRTVAFLRRDDWQPALEHPLGLTLPPRPVSMPGNLTEQEQQIARTIALYDYRFQPLGDGSLVLVAAPIQG